MRTIRLGTTRSVAVQQPVRSVAVVKGSRTVKLQDECRTVTVQRRGGVAIQRTSRAVSVQKSRRTVVVANGPRGIPGPAGPTGSTAGLVQIQWAIPGIEAADTIEIVGSVLDYDGSPLASSVVDVEVRVTDGAVDGEPSATAYLTAANSPVGTVLAGSGTASMVIRSDSGSLKVAIHESLTSHRYLWIRAAGHERVWVRSADGVQELIFA